VGPGAHLEERMEEGGGIVSCNEMSEEQVCRVTKVGEVGGESGDAYEFTGDEPFQRGL
jgi:hypothetical protein